MGQRTHKSKCCIQTKKDIEKSKFCQAGYDTIIGLDKAEILGVQRAIQKRQNDNIIAYTPFSSVRWNMNGPSGKLENQIRITLELLRNK